MPTTRRVKAKALAAAKSPRDMASSLMTATRSSRAKATTSRGTHSNEQSATMATTKDPSSTLQPTPPVDSLEGDDSGAKALATAKPTVGSISIQVPDSGTLSPTNPKPARTTRTKSASGAKAGADAAATVGVTSVGVTVNAPFTASTTTRESNASAPTADADGPSAATVLATDASVDKAEGSVIDAIVESPVNAKPSFATRVAVHVASTRATATTIASTTVVTPASTTANALDGAPPTLVTKATAASNSLATASAAPAETLVSAKPAFNTSSTAGVTASSAAAVKVTDAQATDALAADALC